MTLQAEMDRLQKIVAADLASPADIARLKELQAQVQSTPPPAPSSSAATVRAGTGELFLSVNTDAFQRGGEQFTPPPGEAVLPGVLVEVLIPDFVDDQVWFVFESLPGNQPYYRGALVTAALNRASEQSGAWKVKDVLDALGATYEVVEGQGVRIQGHIGLTCQVEWLHVDIRGKKELRIQNVYRADTRIESAV